MASKTTGLAYIFPGQGSQYVGMGRDLVENFSAAREVFEKADEALGFSLSELCFNGPEAELQLTENTQPAILTVSVAAFRVMEAEGFPMPSYVAGHSLGEYSAVVAAGGLALEDAVRLVRKRGLYMQEAVPVGEGAMAAIVGKGDIEAAVKKACRAVLEKEGEVCSLANVNAPHQIVISGHTAPVERAMRLLQEECPNVRRVIKLNVSAPFHSSLMRPAQEKLAAELDSAQFRNLRFPLLVADVPFPVLVQKGAAACEWLIKQVSSPVKWRQAVSYLALKEHVTTFVEVGPGKVLSGLVRHTAGGETLHVGDRASLEATRAALSETQAVSGGN
jgi:[acyl-carrier-protein] S-malonyltransferase